MTAADFLQKALQGQCPPWPIDPAFQETLYDAAEEEGVLELLLFHLKKCRQMAILPTFLARLEEQLQYSSAVCLLRSQETAAVLNALAEQGVHCVILKGMALAHTLYPSPALRPLADTDLLIRKAQIEKARQVMAARGYVARNVIAGDEANRQFDYRRDSGMGFEFVFDFHWAVSNPHLFSELLSFDQSQKMLPQTILGPHARCFADEDALILGCVHLIAHHFEEQRLIWLYDLHLLSQKLDAAAWKRFAKRAIERKVAGVCAFALRQAQSRLGTVLSSELLLELERHKEKETSSFHLAPGNERVKELLSNLRSLPGFSRKFTYLKEIAFPSRQYMMAKYPDGAKPLPLLYLRRAFEGLGKWFFSVK